MSAPVWAALDSAVAVTAPDDVLARLHVLLGPPAAAAPTAAVEVRGRDVLLDGALEPPQPHVVGGVLTALNRAVLAQCRSFATHAGVVALGGRGVVLPGTSGAGKTTLVAACAQAGLAVVSDEALVLAADGTVRPYARPLSLAPWSAARLGLQAWDVHEDGDAGSGGQGGEEAETAVPLAALGDARAGDPLRVAHVLVPQRGADRAAVVPTGRAGTAALLLQRSFNHYRDPQGALALVAGVVRGARCGVLQVGDPEEAARLLRDVLEQDVLERDVPERLA